MEQADSRLVSEQEMAQCLGVSQKTVKRLRVSGMIPYLQVGKSPRFVTEEVLRCLHVERTQNGEGAECATRDAGRNA